MAWSSNLFLSCSRYPVPLLVFGGWKPSIQVYLPDVSRRVLEWGGLSCGEDALLPFPVDSPDGQNTTCGARGALDALIFIFYFVWAPDTWLKRPCVCFVCVNCVCVCFVCFVYMYFVWFVYVCALCALCVCMSVWALCVCVYGWVCCVCVCFMYVCFACMLCACALDANVFVE